MDKIEGVRDIHSTEVVVPYKKHKHVVVSLMDITDRNRLNKSLRVVSEINDLVAREKRPDTVIKTVCNKLEEVYGLVYVCLVQGDNIRTFHTKINEINCTYPKTCPITENSGKQCTKKTYLNEYRIPLIYNKNYGVITILTDSKIKDEELGPLKKFQVT